MIDEWLIKNTKLPKNVPISEYIKDRAKGFVVITLFGIPYYIPITKDTKKLFNIKKIKNTFIFNNYKAEHRFEQFIRDIINVVYLQVRDTVGEEIQSKLSAQMQDGFNTMFGKIINKKINQEFQKLLPYKNA